MGIETKIQWCHHTFNPWIGCTKVSEGCKHCYAEELMDKRYGKVQWGPDGTRVVTSDAYWRQPIKWNREAEKAGERRRVFCASLADVFEDRDELINWRIGLFDLIQSTPHLDWLLLTKRPEFARVWLECSRVQGLWPLPNIWLGTSIENQETADKRIPELLKIPAAVRFLSVEPLLGPVDLSKWLGFMSDLDWVIIGGESGPHARPCDIAWIRSIVGQCKAAGVAVFVKQVGAHTIGPDPDSIIDIKDKKGGLMGEWPEDIRIRQFPKGVS